MAKRVQRVPRDTQLVPFSNNLVRLYIIEGSSQKEMIREMEVETNGRLPKFTEYQWKDRLNALKIFKNLNVDEAAFIWTKKGNLGQPGNYWDVLVLTNNSGVLIDVREVERHLRAQAFVPKDPEPESRSFTFIPLDFNVARLDDPSIFNNFRRLLWFTNVHFNSCFDTGKWSKDQNGIYGRSDELRHQLTNLSSYHNKLSGAIENFRVKKNGFAFALTGSASELHRAIVQSYHHRQFPDLLAILLMFERERNLGKVKNVMTKDLYSWAQLLLRKNDPRRGIFQALMSLPLDATGDLYLAFDAYCRHLWQSKVGGDQIEAYYSYNQASLPRSEAGKFYSLYAGKALQDIQHILKQVDDKFGVHHTASFCLWHTAIRYLLRERRFEDANNICNCISGRLAPLHNTPQLNLPSQLNMDVSLSYYLIGEVRSTVMLFGESMQCLDLCLQTRTLVTQIGIWDPVSEFALRMLIDVTERLGFQLMAQQYQEQLHRMRSAVESRTA